MTTKKPATLKIEYVAIDDVEPHPDNPRTISEEKKANLRRLIDHFGLVVPLVIWHNFVIGGSQRWLVMKELAHEEVPVIRQDVLSENDAKALMVAFNNLEAQGEYDQIKLAEILNTLATSKYDATLTGYAQESIAKLQRAAAEADTPKMRDVDTSLPLDRVWVLLGVPTPRYNEVDSMVRKIASLDDVVCETTVGD
jgi:hypothetical protein